MRQEILQRSDLREGGSEMVGTQKSSHRKLISILVLVFAISLWSGCGGGMNVGASGTSEPTSNGVKITPSNSTIRAGATTQFSATVTGNANQAVTWSVNGMAAGTSAFGTIDTKGMYHAPAAIPTPNAVQVQAVSVWSRQNPFRQCPRYS